MPLAFVAYLPFVPAENWAHRVGERLAHRNGVTRSMARQLLPERVRAALLGAHRRFVFRRAMQRFIADPKGVAREFRVLRRLVYGWGNEAFSAHEEYLAAVVEQAHIAEGPVLECGSGLSSVLVGVVLGARGLPHWVLEHDPSWARKTERYLRRYASGSVLVSKPLQDYGEFDWYALPSEGLPESFSLVVCDGPPGTTRGGRSGLFPTLRGNLKPGAVILLDDAGRDAEGKLARSWQADLPATLAILGATKPYAMLRLL